VDPAERRALKAVAVLMVMHLAIAVVTYNALVRIAPTRHGGRGSPRRPAQLVDDRSR